MSVLIGMRESISVPARENVNARVAMNGTIIIGAKFIGNSEKSLIIPLIDQMLTKIAHRIILAKIPVRNFEFLRSRDALAAFRITLNNIAK